jgi:hypothetical protein|tara:strand:+ start:536 stop:1114 length:579 start_codon:yes stop_codon:yes gene_type:complete
MKKILFIILSLSLLTECGIYRKTDARKIPGNVNDRVQKNLEEGKRIKFGGGKGRGDGNFSFATSNEMWRATIEILDFIPLNNADYGGGIIITDWYNEDGTENNSIKIMVRFLSNEIRADGLKVTIYNKTCKSISGVQNCSTQIDNSGEVGQELKLAILKKAAIYKTTSTKKNAEEFNKKRPTSVVGERAGQK